MKRREKDEILASHLPGILQYHQLMLADGVRNKLLYHAIKQYVTSETRFLDIGAGTGVWAILAAMLGAKRVVAVEIEESLIPIIFRHAQENGVADKIEIIHGNSNDVKIRGKFDVIVSELFGTNAFGKETIDSFIDLRKRFLASEGVLIPQKLSMHAAPVHYQKYEQPIPSGLPLSSNFLKSLSLNYSENVSLADRSKIRFLAKPQKLLEISFKSVKKAPSLENLTASWEVKNPSQANAIVVFSYSTFTHEIVMDNFASQSWGTVVYDFEPYLIKKPETMKLNLTIDNQKSLWTISLPFNTDFKPKTYSPAFAVARIKMAQRMTPYRRFKSTKTKNKNKS